MRYARTSMDGAVYRVRCETGVGDEIGAMKMAKKAGPQMVKHVIDGHVVLLPADAVLVPNGETLEQSMKRPLGGAWK